MSPKKIKPSEPTQQKHVLIIDDDESVRASLAELLRVCGFRISLASDGELGVKKALALRPDIVLLDLGIPKLSGLEAAARIRAALGDDIFLLALSGHGELHYQVRAAACGIDQYLVKPMDPEKLIQLLSAGKPLRPLPTS